MANTFYHELAEIEARNESAVLCTIIGTRGSTPRRAGSKLLLYADGHFIGTVGGGEVENLVIAEARAALLDGRPRHLSYDMVDPSKGDAGVCGGSLEVYVEPIVPKPTLLVVGGGHVGKAVVHLAAWLDFFVAVSDDRVEFCTPQAQPDAHAFYPIAMADLPGAMSIDQHTYIVMTTRGTNVDVAGLPSLLATDAAYIGVIGSRRRWAVTRKALLAAGVPEEQLARVVSPIGLEINAETPEEIAVSILAEILMMRNGGSGLRMKME